MEERLITEFTAQPEQNNAGERLGD